MMVVLRSAELPNIFLLMTRHSPSFTCGRWCDGWRIHICISIAHLLSVKSGERAKSLLQWCTRCFQTELLASWCPWSGVVDTFAWLCENYSTHAVCDMHVARCLMKLCTYAWWRHVCFFSIGCFMQISIFRCANIVFWCSIHDALEATHSTHAKRHIARMLMSGNKQPISIKQKAKTLSAKLQLSTINI